MDNNQTRISYKKLSTLESSPDWIATYNRPDYKLVVFRDKQCIINNFGRVTWLTP